MADDLMERVRALTLEPPGSRRAIAVFLEREGSAIARLTMAEVADLAYTSKPSLVRFAQELGFDGWRSFRLAFVQEAIARERHASDASPVDVNHPFTADDGLDQAISQVSLLERQAIEEALGALDTGALAEAARRVLAARTLVFFGAPPNCFFGELFAYKLSQIGRMCVVPSEDRWRGVALGLMPDDCAIVSSYSGEGERRLPGGLMVPLREAGVPVVAITNSSSNWVLDHADCALTFAPREHYYSKVSGYYSEICIHAILDALYSACFAADYERNARTKLRIVVEYERQRTHHLKDILPA